MCRSAVKPVNIMFALIAKRLPVGAVIRDLPDELIMTFPDKLAMS
jgi:hypothetical protein